METKSPPRRESRRDGRNLAADGKATLTEQVRIENDQTSPLRVHHFSKKRCQVVLEFEGFKVLFFENDILSRLATIKHMIAVLGTFNSRTGLEFESSHRRAVIASRVVVGKVSVTNNDLTACL